MVQTYKEFNRVSVIKLCCWDFYNLEELEAKESYLEHTTDKIRSVGNQEALHERRKLPFPDCPVLQTEPHQWLIGALILSHLSKPGRNSSNMIDNILHVNKNSEVIRVPKRWLSKEERLLLWQKTPSSVPSTHVRLFTITLNFSSSRLDALFWPPGAPGLIAVYSQDI